MVSERIEDSYPLSPMQQGMLFHSLYAPKSGVDIEQIVCTLRENLNVLAFEQTWQRVIERHPVLRTSFRWQGLEQPLQEVHRYIKCPLEQQDWRSLSRQEQEARLSAYLRADRRRGFELTEAPLMRLALFWRAEAGYQFVWTFHHALLDGRSFPIVLKEVFAFYEAFCQGQTLELEPPRPYRDYIDWLQQQDLSQLELFWRRQLKGFTTPTPLTVDRPPAKLSDDHNGADHGLQQIELSAALTSTLQSLAQQHHLTLNTLVQGAWVLLLSRYSGETDVVFGATRACRRSALEGIGTESMVGLFINTLPMRVRVPSDMPVLTWLKELRAQSLAMREAAREHTPLVKIQEWSEVPRGEPLFESILVFENHQLNTLLRTERDQSGNWQNREFELLGQTNYPLTVLGYAGDSLLLKLRYDRDHFEDGAIRRMLEHMRTLLQGFVDNPEQRLLDMPLLTKIEQHQLLVEWNNTQTEYPRDQCIHTLFEAQVERTPNAFAVTFEDERLTYQELNRRANQLAHHLRALGVGPEMLVGICVERSLEMIVGLLGVLKAGAAYVPLDPVLPKERLAFMLADTQAPVLLMQQRLFERLPHHSAHLICIDTDWDTIAQESEENPASGATPENLAYVIFTSGSTGRSKGVAIEHRQLHNYLNGILERLRLPAGVSFAMVSTFAADLGNTAIFPALCTGGCLYVVSQERAADPEALADYFRRYPIDCLKIVPSHLAALLGGSQPEQILPRQRLVLGGEASGWDLVEKIQSLAPDCLILNHYGPTEATVGVTTYRVEPDHPTKQRRDIGSTTLPLGRPIANTQIYLLDAHLQPVPIGVPGELYIGGDSLARGYLNRPDLTAERFIPPPFTPSYSPPTSGEGKGRAGARLYRTGDLARYLPDGNLDFLGRVDRQVKIRGFRIELGEIEAVLTEHPAIREGVVAVDTELVPGNVISGRDKRLVAYFVPTREPAPPLSELRDFLKKKLPDQMIPSAFVKLEAIPLTPNGKVDHRKLPAPMASQIKSVEDFVSPRNPTEDDLANIWAEILGLEKVGVYDNFFELGGHSLLATRVISRIREVFKVELPLRRLFETPTVMSLAEYIETVRWARQAPHRRVELDDREEIVL
jgi:surfactin family lipopeptide synthetase C